MALKKELINRNLGHLGSIHRFSILDIYMELALHYISVIFEARLLKLNDDMSRRLHNVDFTIEIIYCQLARHFQITRLLNMTHGLRSERSDIREPPLCFVTRNGNVTKPQHDATRAYILYFSVKSSLKDVYYHFQKVMSIFSN